MFELIEKIQEFVKKNELLSSNILDFNKELLYANIFRDSITDVDWIKNKGFSASGHAANYSFLYILFRALNDLKPMNIMEIGIGQTSKLTFQYIYYNNSDAKLSIVENDQNWINTFKPNLKEHQNIQIFNLPIKEITRNNEPTSTYEGLENIINNEKYDLILVDGRSSTKYSRSYVLDFVPHHLSDSFVIIIDDAERSGEIETVEELKIKLKSCNINYFFGQKKGLKKQSIFCSSNRKYILTM